MRGFWPRVFLALFAPVAIGLIVSASVFSCYAHTPTPTCSADPTQPWCWHPPAAERADAGR